MAKKRAKKPRLKPQPDLDEAGKRDWSLWQELEQKLASIWYPLANIDRNRPFRCGAGARKMRRGLIHGNIRTHLDYLQTDWQTCGPPNTLRRPWIREAAFFELKGMSQAKHFRKGALFWFVFWARKKWTNNLSSKNLFQSKRFGHMCIRISNKYIA